MQIIKDLENPETSKMYALFPNSFENSKDDNFSVVEGYVRFPKMKYVCVGIMRLFYTGSFEEFVAKWSTPQGVIAVTDNDEVLTKHLAVVEKVFPDLPTNTTGWYCIPPQPSEFVKLAETNIWDGYPDFNYNISEYWKELM